MFLHDIARHLLLYTKYVFFVDCCKAKQHISKRRWEGECNFCCVAASSIYFRRVYVRVWVWLAICINCTFYGYIMLVCTYLRVFAVFLNFCACNFPQKKGFSKYLYFMLYNTIFINLKLQKIYYILSA